MLKFLNLKNFISRIKIKSNSEVYFVYSEMPYVNWNKDQHNYILMTKSTLDMYREVLEG